MSIKKGATVLAVGSLVCIALSGLRSPAVARQEEKKAHTKAAPISKAVAILLHHQGEQGGGARHLHADRRNNARPCR